MNKKIPRMSWLTKKLINRYKDKLINHDQKAGKFTPAISAMVDHIDAIMELIKNDG